MTSSEWINSYDIVAYADLEQYDISKATIIYGDVTVDWIDYSEDIVCSGNVTVIDTNVEEGDNV